MKRFQCFARLLTVLLTPLLPGAVLGQTAVLFPDPNLETAVRSALGKPSGELTSTDLLALERLGASGQGITRLDGLEGARNLELLVLNDNAIEDLTPLAGLTALHYLFLDGNHVTNGTPLAGLTNLVSLLLGGNSIHELSWVTRLDQLQELRLVSNRPLENGPILATLTNLNALYINDTGISDLSWVSALTKLTRLGAGENDVSDASPVAALTQLQFLGLGGNPLGNCSVVAGLTNLDTLYLFENGLTDVSCLAGLKKLTWLRLADNQLSDVSPVAGLTQLQYLDLSDNPLSNCAPVAGLAQLSGLDLSRDSLTDINCLSGLRHLAFLKVNDNHISDGSPLAGLVALQSLNLSNNLLANLNFAPALTALTNLVASDNRLTDISGLLGLEQLSSVALSDNPLDLTFASPARKVLEALQGRGVTLDLSLPTPPYVPVNGTYNGLVYAGEALTSANCGCITLTTTTRRKYTGKLQLGGQTYALSGSFGTNGTSRNTIKRSKPSLVTVTLALVGTDTLTGTVSASNWTAELLGYRAVFDTQSGSRSLQAGRYTLTLAGSSSSGLPPGNGYGTVTVSPAGRLNFVGALADGTRLSQSAWVSQDGQWPCYVPLYSGKGSVLSWLTFTNDTTLGGALAWTKPNSNTRLYPAGFAGLTPVVGARYNSPPKGANAFGLTNCTMTLTLTGGGLPQELANPFTVNARNQVKALSATNKLQLTFTPTSGLFSGRMVDPNTRKGIPFSGVILQNQTKGCGYFLGPSSSGQVLLSQ